MEDAKNLNIAPELLLCPAFRVENGIVTEVNDAAVSNHIAVGTEIAAIISQGKEEYEAFTGGRLDLTVNTGVHTCSASVISDGTSHIFCLEPEYTHPELRAFALAAQNLREPLTTAMISTNSLLPNASDADPDTKTQLQQLNRSLHQMMRVLCNMSDASQFEQSQDMQMYDATAIFEEVLSKASAFLADSGKNLHVKLPKEPISCSCDEKMLERAVLNLISNAARFSPKGSTILAELKRQNKRLYFTVQNACDTTGSNISKNLFTRYLREPSIEDGRHGVGLGMSLVRSVASAHGGAVLLEQPNDTDFRITFTMEIKKSDILNLRSPICLPFDYTGGWDHCLLELSDVLSSDLYGQ